MRNTLTLRAAQAQVPAYVTSVGRRPRSAAGDAAQSRCLLASGRLRMAISSFLTAAKPQALLVPLPGLKPLLAECQDRGLAAVGNRPLDGFYLGCRGNDWFVCVVWFVCCR